MAVTTAHAEWPFHRVKKAVALTPSEQAYLQEQSKAEAEQVAQAARIASMKAEVIKQCPSLAKETWMFSGSLNKQEKTLRNCLEIGQWDKDLNAVKKEVNEAQNLAQAEAAIKSVSKLEDKFADNEKQQPPNHSVTGVGYDHSLQVLRYSLESKITEIKRKTEADYCLSHCETATTPEEIEASIPHASWFQSRELSDEEFKKAFHETREEWDANYKKRMIASSKEDRVGSIKSVINSEHERDSDPFYNKYREKRDQIMSEIARTDRESALVSAAQEANRIAEHAAMQQHSDAMIQQQAAMQQHLDAENASWRQHEDALYAQPVMPPPSTPYHSGTIYFNNGNAASYGGY